MTRAQILIVEDEALVAEDIQSKLKSLGFDVPAMVPSGEQAVQKAAELRPDLILMDIKLEGEMDGVTAAEQIRARFDIPVVYLTAYADDETLRRAKAGEPFGYILKPFKPGDLRGSVEMALYKHQAERALKQAHEKLEQRVQERTAELASANRVLKQEIAERARAEEALRESEQRFRSIVDHSADGITLVDERGIVVEWNASQERITGLKRGEVLGRPLWDVQFQIALPEEKNIPGAYERIRDLIQSYLETGQAPWLDQFMEREIQRPDDARCVIQAVAFSVPTDKGMMTGGITRDITERKQKELALEQSQQQYESLVNSLDGIVWEADPETFRFSFVSRQAESILGYPVERWLTESTFWQDHIHPSDRERALSFCSRQTQAGRSHEFEYRMIAADGQVVWLHDVVSVSLEAGRPVKLRGVMVDITQRRQAEKEAHKSQQRERVLNALLRISIEDVSLVEQLERALDEILAVPWLPLEQQGAIFLVEEDSDELLLQAHRGFGPALQRACARLPFGKCLCGRAALQGEIEFADRVDARHEIHYEGMSPHGHYCVPIKSGTTVVGLFVLYLQQGHEHDVKETEFLQGVARTLAGMIERKQAAEALQDSERRYRLLAENATDMISRHTPEGLYLYASPACHSLLGYTPEEMVGRDSYEFFHPQDIEAIQVSHSTILEQPVSYAVRYRLRRRDGDYVWVETTSKTVRQPETGEVQEIVALTRDVTERVRAEQALQQAHDELEVRVQQRTAELRESNQRLREEIDERRRTEETLRRFRAALDNSADSVFLIDRATMKFIDVNETACDELGYSRQELLTMGPQHIKPLYTLEELAREFDDVIAGTRTGIIETVHRRRDGSEFPVEVFLRALALENRPLALENRPLASENRPLLIASVRDITERRQAEEALRQSADELAALYTVTATAASQLDPDELLSTALEVILAALGADAGWMALVEASPDVPPRPVTWRNLPDAVMAVEGTISLGERQLYTAWQEGDRTKPRIITECPCRVAEALDETGLRSHACVPLSAGGRLLGMLNLAWKSPHVGPELNRPLLLTIGQQVGIALRNAQLYQSARQVDRLRVLNAIGAAAVSSLELDSVLQEVLRLTCRALGADRGAILLREEGSERLVIAQTMDGPDDVLRGHHLAWGQGIAGWVAAHGQAVRANWVREDPRWYGGMDELTGLETHSLVCAPLMYRDEVVGAIEIVNKLQGEFTEEDLSLLVAVASNAAAALENARLYTATRSYADRMVRLYQVGQALTATLDFDAVVQAALTHIQGLFEADSVSLLQPDPETADLHLVGTKVEDAPPEMPRRLLSGQGVARQALTSRQPVLVEDLQEDSRFVTHGRYPFRARALMAVPLLTLDREVGIVEVVSSAPGVYLSKELNTLQTVASTLTVALENVRLYEELKASLQERERTQAQLIHSEKMTALGRLVASIAHEINNPLQAVQGCLALTGEELAGEQRQGKLERYLDIAESEIERIAAIVRRVRDFYRPAHEEVQFADLHLVLDSVLELTDKQLQHNEIAVERVWAENLPPARANADHLKQVFLNMVLNAADAMPDGGTLRVRTAMAASQGQPVLRIDFSDDGIGMSPQTQARLFEPFFTTKPSGSGLGLSISYGIIQSHGGQITVASQKGQGSTFTIHLPASSGD